MAIRRFLETGVMGSGDGDLRAMRSETGEGARATKETEGQRGSGDKGRSGGRGTIEGEGGADKRGNDSARSCFRFRSERRGIGLAGTRRATTSLYRFSTTAQRLTPSTTFTSATSLDLRRLTSTRDDRGRGPHDQIATSGDPRRFSHQLHSIKLGPSARP